MIRCHGAFCRPPQPSVAKCGSKVDAVIVLNHGLYKILLGQICLKTAIGLFRFIGFDEPKWN